MWIWLAYSLCPSKSHPETVIVFVSKFWNDACILQLPNERILQNSILSSVEQNCKVQNHFMRSSKFDFIGPTKQRRSTQNWILREHSMFIFSFHHACWHSSIFYFLPSAKWKFKFINDWKCWISCNSEITSSFASCYLSTASSTIFHKKLTTLRKYHTATSPVLFTSTSKSGKVQSKTAIVFSDSRRISFT